MGANMSAKPPKSTTNMLRMALKRSQEGHSNSQL